MSTANLQIQITAEFAQLRQALASVQQQLDKVRTSGNNVGSGAQVTRLNGQLQQTAVAARNVSTSLAGANTQLARLNQRMQQTLGGARNLAASLGLAFSATGLARASDEAQNITARLKLATNSANEFKAAQQATFQVAQRTRTSLQATVDLYSRIERSTREQKVNQATILQLTETINRAAQISGGGAGAEAAIFQLNQGLASGTLRGEELNSVLEQTPRLAQAIADGMNLPIGQLRKVAQEGKLTSEAVLRALLSQSKTIQEEFAEFPPTIASGFTAIRNSLVQYLATSGEAGSAANSLAVALQKIAENLPAIIDLFLRLGPVVLAVYTGFKLWPLITIAVTAATAALARFNVQLALSTPAMRAAAAQAVVLTTRMAAMGPATAAAGITAAGALSKIRSGFLLLISAVAGWQLGTYLSDQFLQVRLAGLALVVGLDVAFKTLAGGFRQIGLTIRETFVSAFNFVIDKAEGFYRALGNAASNIPGVGGKVSQFYNGVADDLKNARMEAEGVANVFNRVYQETEAAKNSARELGMELADYLIEEERLKNAAAGGTGGQAGLGGAGTAAASLKEMAKIASTQADLVTDSVQRALAQLQRLYDQGKMSIRDYFAEKQRLETQSIDAQLEAARAERRAATGADEVAVANANIIKLMRDRKQVSLDAINAQADAERDLADQLTQLDIRRLQATGQNAAATRARLEQEMRDLKVRLQSEGDEAGLALANSVIDLETLDARLAEAGQRIQDAMQKFQNTETSTGAQVNAGMLGMDEGKDRVNQQRERSLELLIKQREELVKIQVEAAKVGDAFTLDKANEALQELDGNIANLSVNTQAFGYQVAQVAKGALTTLFQDLASGSKTAGEALNDFVLNFIQGMAAIAAQALATYLVLQLLDAIYPGLGKLVASTGGAVASNHSGGMAGSGGGRRMMPSLAFAGAPRLHTGGIAGLGPDEVPIVAKRNEEVLTANDPRHRYNGGLNRGEDDAAGTRFVFVDDQRDVGNFLESSRGERTIVRIMQRNQASLNK